MVNKLTDRSGETREFADAREKLVRLQSSIIITCFTVSDWYDPANVVEFLTPVTAQHSGRRTSFGFGQLRQVSKYGMII